MIIGPRSKQFSQIDNDGVLVGENRIVEIQNSKPNWKSYSDLPAEVGNVIPSTNGARLTWVSDDPTGLSNVSLTIFTFYWLPYTSNQIALYDGTRWDYHTIPDVGLSKSLSDTDINSNPLVVSTLYDVFVRDNGGLILEYVPWTSSAAGSSVRGMTHDIVKQNGVYVRNSDRTSRYIGTFRTDDSFAFPKMIAAPTSRIQIYVWNAYNQIELNTVMHTGGAAFSGTVSLRPWNNSFSFSSHRAEFVCGLYSHIFMRVAHRWTYSFSGTPGFSDPEVAIGFNSNSSASSRALTNGSRNRQETLQETVTMNGMLSNYAFGYNWYEPLHEFNLVGPQGGSVDGGVRFRVRI